MTTAMHAEACSKIGSAVSHRICWQILWCASAAEHFHVWQFLRVGDYIWIGLLRCDCKQNYATLYFGDEWQQGVTSSIFMTPKVVLITHGSVLNWFKSYLSSRSFRVKCDNHMSSPHTCSCGVPQGSVLGPLLFIMYTTPPSTLISSLSLNHHLYADDT